MLFSIHLLIFLWIFNAGALSADLAAEATSSNASTPNTETSSDSTPTPVSSTTPRSTAGTSGISSSRTSETPLPPLNSTTTSGTTTRPTTATTTYLTPPVSIFCPSAPCPFDSLCLNGTCQCVSGTYLTQGSCRQARVFTGQLHLIQTFNAEMSNRSSDIFRQTADDISAVLRGSLSTLTGFIRTDVVQLRPGSVVASVNNVFDLSSSATESATNTAIEKAITDCVGSCSVLRDATFNGTNLCEQSPLPCEVVSTDCFFQEGVPICSCKPGYINSLYSNKSCTACPSGQRAYGDVCVQCSFGYAGFNCNDSALLAVVVVACVLGGVLLLLLLALLLCNSWRCRSQSEKKSADLNSPYPAEGTRSSWSNIRGITPIPRASTNWDPTPIEMTEGGSTLTLVDQKSHTNGGGFRCLPKLDKKKNSYDLTTESLNTFTGKSPSRYSYLVQGHENPYFVAGDEKITL
ncbi:hypothetical protein DPEC_G00276720 [Dallia pectoralis]|uniref:Uncharacterized protein n=1 Tax=Dallia pectoralis TaxID=75939 RepID=A0ACC2FLY7_DALPE|nr:hypothetical protein DPEC_G00276720 [Dallia pectoralis]